MRSRKLSWLRLCACSLTMTFAGCSKATNDPILEFSLPRLDDPVFLLTPDDLNSPAIVNVWASWCVPCRKEVPQLVALSKFDGANVYGLSYRDTHEDAQRWLNYYGNPYQIVGVDSDGSQLEALVSHGIPQTFLLLRGQIIFRHIGPLNDRVLEQQLLPLVEQFKAQLPTATNG